MTVTVTKSHTFKGTFKGQSTEYTGLMVQIDGIVMGDLVCPTKIVDELIARLTAGNPEVKTEATT